MPHPKGGAEHKMSRETALLARLEKQYPNDRAFGMAPLARSQLKANIDNKN